MKDRQGKIESGEMVAWTPQEGPQTLAIQCPAFELLIGGAVGGGKTDFLLGDYIKGEPLGSAWIGVYFRKYFPDMDDVINRSMEIYGPVYGPKCYSSSRHQWTFPSGAQLRFRALEKDLDVYKHQGQAYSWVGWDELTQWGSPWPYTYLMSRIRSAKGAQVRVRAGTNPGGAGHDWVKARFLDVAPHGTPHLVKTKSGESYYRVFIPSKLEDNKILMASDPGYADRILEGSDPRMAHALRYGDWDIIGNTVFTEFDRNVHIIPPIEPPVGRPVWRAMDWGFKDPYCCLWFTIDDGDVIVFNEMYGWGGQPNVGSETTASVVKDKICNYESLNDLYVPYGLLDPQCWEQRGQSGLLINELGGRTLGWHKWPKGPDSRRQQTHMIHQFLAVTNGKSRLKITSNCKHLLRTLPNLQRDPRDGELVDTNCEVHAFDALRGGLTKRVQTRDQLREAHARLRMQNLRYVSAADVPGGGF